MEAHRDEDRRFSMTGKHETLTAVVAGGGSGIGRGCALRLAGMGYHVVVVGRDTSKLDQTVAQVCAAGGSALAFQADVRDFDRLGELQVLVGQTGVDLLINSAGGQFAAPSAELSQNGWQSVVDVNLSGSFFLCRQLQPSLRKRRGAIVLIVANMWRRPAPNLAHSAAARAGVVNLMNTLALEWAPDGIRVNAVAPGLTDTPALLDQYRCLADRVPLKRIGSVDEVVDAILFMGRSRYITGEVLAIDGGLHLT
jgi:NAD(P)-dependent dehydrogenase (short-subunit alcohol dehydrogenase family)